MKKLNTHSIECRSWNIEYRRKKIKDVLYSLEILTFSHFVRESCQVARVLEDLDELTRFLVGRRFGNDLVVFLVECFESFKGAY